MTAWRREQKEHDQTPRVDRCALPVLADGSRRMPTRTWKPVHPGAASIVGLQHLPALEQLIDDKSQGGSGPGVVLYQWAGDAVPQALMNLSDKLEVVGLDGSGERQLATDIACAGVPSVTADGRWGACIGYNGSSTIDWLEVVSLAEGSTQHQVFHLSSDGSYYDLSWAPDGTRLAVLANYGFERPCAVQVYRASARYDPFEPVVSFTSDAFSSYGACNVVGLTWSPKGAQLMVVATSPGSLLVNDHVPVPSAAMGSSASAVIPAEQFTSISTSAQSRRELTAVVCS
jgi:hypothetical protein